MFDVKAISSVNVRGGDHRLLVGTFHQFTRKVAKPVSNMTRIKYVKLPSVTYLENDRRIEDYNKRKDVIKKCPPLTMNPCI